MKTIFRLISTLSGVFLIASQAQVPSVRDLPALSIKVEIVSEMDIAKRTDLVIAISITNEGSRAELISGWMESGKEALANPTSYFNLLRIELTTGESREDITLPFPFKGAISSHETLSVLVHIPKPNSTECNMKFYAISSNNIPKIGAIPNHEIDEILFDGERRTTAAWRMLSEKMQAISISWRSAQSK